MLESQTKYYIPEPEEFHIVFEYEFNTTFLESEYGPNDEFIETTIEEPDDLVLAFEHLERNGCRVKYLDKEDIESLGFKLIGQKHFQSLTDESKFVIKESIDHISVYEFPTNNLNRDEGMPIVFNMLCKNKSKLKSILKDVGVL